MADIHEGRNTVVVQGDFVVFVIGARVGNAFAGLFRSKTRIHVHATREVEGLVRAAGLEERMRRTTTFWQVAVYERPNA